MKIISESDYDIFDFLPLLFIIYGMLRAGARTPLIIQILFIFYLVANEFTAFRGRSRDNSTGTIYDLTSTQTCRSAKQTNPFSNVPTNQLPTNQLPTISPTNNNPSDGCHFKETNFARVKKAITRSVHQQIKDAPERQDELALFLTEPLSVSCNKAEYLSGLFGRPDEAYIVTLAKQTSKLRTTYHLLCSSQEDDPTFVKEVSKLDKYSRKLGKNVATLNIIFRNFPRELRDKVLQNEALLSMANHHEMKIRSSFLENTVQFIVNKTVHTYSKSRFGYWRYAGESQMGTYREIFHRNFGRSPV